MQNLRFCIEYLTQLPGLVHSVIIFEMVWSLKAMQGLILSWLLPSVRRKKKRKIFHKADKLVFPPNAPSLSLSFSLSLSPPFSFFLSFSLCVCLSPLSFFFFLFFFI